MQRSPRPDITGPAHDLTPGVCYQSITTPEHVEITQVVHQAGRSPEALADGLEPPINCGAQPGPNAIHPLSQLVRAGPQMNGRQARGRHEPRLIPTLAMAKH